MSNPHIEWERDYVTKYSITARMKNGLRKTLFYETSCKHNTKTLQEIPCPLCNALFECCQKCYNDYSESDVTVESFDDLICPDCIDQCYKCKVFLSDENGSRSDIYPHDLYCTPCANELGFCYNSPDELSQTENSKQQSNKIINKHNHDKHINSSESESNSESSESSED